MKIAYFVGSLNRGGAEMLTLDICRSKKSAPFEMLLIYRNEGELSEAFLKTGVRMKRIKPGKNKLGYFIAVRRFLKQEGVCIIHSQTLTNALIAAICTLFSGIKTVASFHGFYKSFLQRIQSFIVMWRTHALVFVSKCERDWYIKTSLFCPRSRCHVVYNGISFDRLDICYSTPDFLSSVYQSKPESCVWPWWVILLEDDPSFSFAKA